MKNKSLEISSKQSLQIYFSNLFVPHVLLEKSSTLHDVLQVLQWP